MKSDLENQINLLKSKIENLESELEKKDQDLSKLFHWLNQFQSNMVAISNSLSWKIGDKIRKLLISLLPKKTHSTVFDHIKQLSQEMHEWKPASNTKHRLKVEGQVVSSKNYAQWIEKFDSKVDVKYTKKIIHNWAQKPRISIILFIQNTEKQLLKKTLDSVLSQLYENWELYIAYNVFLESHIKTILDEYTVHDKRIKLYSHSNDGNLAETLNDAIKLTTGSYISFLDQNDTLTNTALFWVVNEILNFPEVKIIYSDEDKVSMDDERCDPYFKPEFNYDLLLSQNYMTHFSVYDAKLINTLSGFKQGIDGAQDYDLLLRAMSQTNEQNIRHIPRILYHCRKTTNASTIDKNKNTHSIGATQKVVASYLKENKISAKVINSPEKTTYSRVKYSLPKDLPLVSIVIPTYNGYEILKKCIESILEKSTYIHYDITIVNNNSDESRTLDYLDTLSKNPIIHVLEYPYSFNFSKMNNFAVKQIKGELICFLNNDIEVITSDWLEEMVSHLLRNNVGIVGARLWYPDNTLQHAGITLGIGGVAGHTFKGLPKGEAGYHNKAFLIQNVSAVTAACMLIKKEDFMDVGGFNEDKLHVAFNDIDLCLKIIQTGKKIVWTPYAELYHHELVSRGYENTSEKILRFKKEKNYMLSRWGKMLENDPFYNPNLSLRNEKYQLSWTPRINIQ